MDTPQPDDILIQVRRYLDGVDAWERDLATEEDVIIMQCLLEAVRAARSKGYSEELLIQVLRGLIRTPPAAS